MAHNTDNVRMFPALKVLERQTAPLKFGRPPYWRAPVTPASENVYVPVWNWTAPVEMTDGLEVTVLDVNAAYLSALGGVKIAHSHLKNTGELAHLPAPKEVAPGYYRITVPHWAFVATIVHPLGDSARLEAESTLWIAAPTLILLLELAEEGHIGSFQIIDSYTPDVVTTFLSWAERLRSVRCECLDRIDMAQTESRRQEEVARYDAFKRGYSSALSMMLTGEKSLTWRPDWAHTVYAQHAASTWRKAWRYSFSHPLVAMGAVDEIAVLSQDLPAVLGLPKPPFRLDNRGRQPGAFKIKRRTMTGEDAAQQATTLTTIEDDGDDIL